MRARRVKLAEALRRHPENEPGGADGIFMAFWRLANLTGGDDWDMDPDGKDNLAADLAESVAIGEDAIGNPFGRIP